MAQAVRDSIKPHILHEKQEEGSMLCAQHCLNNVLQGHYFDAAQLGDTAKQLDEAEREQLELSDAQWDQREVQNRNADETGFFSLGVVETALQVWGLSLPRWASQDMRQFHSRPEDQLAFVLNLDSHWFCFRSFGTAGDVWFNLNSFLPEPTWVGSGYLGALLDQAQREGYSVFALRPSASDAMEQENVIQQLRSSSADQIADEAAFGTAGVSRSGRQQEDDELERALQASMQQSSSNATTVPSGSSSSRRRSSNGTQRPKGRRRSHSPLRGGSSRDTAIDLDEANETSDAFAPTTSRSPFLNASLRDQLVEGIDEGDDLELSPQNPLATPAAGADTDRPAPAAPARRRPAGNESQPIEIGDDWEDEIDDFDESALAGRDNRWDEEEAMHQRFTSAAHAFSQMQDRDYDDEDAELQRALAASMADHGAASEGGAAGMADQGGSEETWLHGEDLEEQRRIMAQIAERSTEDGEAAARTRNQRSPTPADVGRITKMRAEAKQKEAAEAERKARHERGQFTPEPEPEPKRLPKSSKDDASDSDDDDDDDANDGEDGAAAKAKGNGDGNQVEEEKPFSPEELRRMRLARFGA